MLVGHIWNQFAKPGTAIVCLLFHCVCSQYWYIKLEFAIVIILSQRFLGKHSSAVYCGFGHISEGYA